MRAHAVLLLALGLCSVLLSSERAGAESKAVRTPFFVVGPRTVGLSLGYGHGVSAIAAGEFESQDVRAFVALLHWQMDLTRRPLEPAWYKGSVALRLEPTFLVNFSPRSGYLVGFDILLRYRLLRWDSVTPYLELGAGPAYIDLDLLDQVDGFAFIPTAGAGVTWRGGERLSFDLGVRLQHVSNAYTNRPNGGVDTVQLLLGVAYSLD